MVFSFSSCHSFLVFPTIYIYFHLVSQFLTDGSAFRMLPAPELKSVMAGQVREVVEVLGVPPSAAHVLMREHKVSKGNSWFWTQIDCIRETELMCSYFVGRVLHYH